MFEIAYSFDFEKNRKKFETWFDKFKKRYILKTMSPMSDGWLKNADDEKNQKKFKTWFDKFEICGKLIKPSHLVKVVWKLNSAM